MLRRFGFLSLVLSALVTSPAWAQTASSAAPAPDAEALIVHGVELRQHGQDEAALAEFRRAYDLGHSVRALAQVALAEQALGRWSQAEHDLAAALAEASDPWIARNRGVLEGALQTIRTHLATLTVTSNVAGAELWVNGQRVASLPMSEPVHVEAGTVAIEVRAQGYVTARRTVDAAAGSSHRESLYSEPVETETHAGAPSHAEGNLAASTAPVDVHAGASRRTIGLGVLVGGGALVLGGVAFHAYWQTRVALYNSDDCFYGGVQRSVRCGGVLDNANAAEIAAITLYTVGGAALVVGGILTLTAPSAHASSQHARNVVCGPGPGSLGVACAGLF